MGQHQPSIGSTSRVTTLYTLVREAAAATTRDTDRRGVGADPRVVLSYLTPPPYPVAKQPNPGNVPVLDYDENRGSVPSRAVYYL